MQSMARILVTEEIAESGLQRLRAAGHAVDVRLGLSRDELLAAVAGAEALIIRSATTVDGELLAAADRLMVVGRAGIGLDNVDLERATARGVMVVNAPESNVVSAAEHTMALLLAQARNVPQAHAALVDGRWERSKWEGVELADKTLGIVGLGRIGKLVADRARGFGMRLVAFDPYVSAERARLGGVELMTPRAGRRRVRLPHHPPAEDRRDDGADRPRAAAQGQARPAHRQRRPRRDRRRGGPRRGAP